MIEINDKNLCCGCAACVDICSFSAINMKPDEDGFIYPSVDKGKCRECGLCEKVCHFSKDIVSLSDGEPQIFAAINKDEDIRFKSTSGGFFSGLSDCVIEEGGVVYGAAFDKAVTVHHIRAINKEERNKCRGSKYIQSNMDGAYKKAKRDLIDGEKVIFSGTPCQIAGLRAFLAKEYDNLITVEVVCHGVPSEKFWLDFLMLAEKKTGHRVVAANVRDKSKYGWHHPLTKLFYEDGKPHSFRGEQSFFELFNTNLILRPSCLACKYITYHRPADISIGDYWGIERFRKDFDDNKGTSQIIINTEKGKLAFEACKERMEYFACDKEHCYQGRLNGRSYINPKTEQFRQEYREKGISYVLWKYTDYNWINKYWKKVIRRIELIMHKGS